jgi:hypothetical protein
LTDKRSWVATTRRYVAYGAFVAAVSLVPDRAAAEKVIVNADGWQIFTDGRAGGFVSHAYGDGYPQPRYGIDPTTGMYVVVDTPQEGAGFRSISENGLIVDPSMTGGTLIQDQGTINLTRVRSGFVSNIFGVGVRGKLTEWTTLSVYMQFWSFIENDGRQKNLPNQADVRQGWAKLEGPWGSFTAGRVRGLFSRGNTDIDVLYAHRWGVGWPGALDNKGPSLGQLSFGVLGAGFSAGMVYVTPSLGGLQLNIGAFDPVQLQGYGNFTRTKYARPEAELTFERPFAGGWGKVALFANGVWQKVYPDAYCNPMVLEPITNKNLPCDATVAGVGYGGRLELGRFHLGMSGFYGQGLGLKYALEVSEAAQDRKGNLRRSKGVHIQSQVVLGKVDVFAGWGIALIDLTDYDRLATVQDPRDPMNPAAQVFQYTMIKHQMGINAGVVYNVTPNLHIDLDIFGAEALWYRVNALPQQKQVVWVGNAGMMISW